MSGRWRCHDCGARFETPSFSPGPKFVDQETLEVDRFREARDLCPECLSSNLGGPANPDPLTPIQVRRARP